MQENTPARFSPRSRVALIAAVVVILLTATILFLAARYVLRIRERLVSELMHPVETQVDVTALVSRVRDLNRLETAAMHVMTVTTSSESYQYMPDAFAGDTLTLMAAGDVIAGVDLSQLKRSDVSVGPGNAITIRMPPPQLLVSRLDNRESKVLSRKTGVLRKQSIGLEGHARQHAEQAIRNEAVKQGILRLASANAETKLAGFLQTVGFRNVRFLSGQTSAPPVPPL